MHLGYTALEADSVLRTRVDSSCCCAATRTWAAISAAAELCVTDTLHRTPGLDLPCSAAPLIPRCSQRIFAPVGSRPCLLLVSGADECVPRQDQIAPRAAALQAVIGPRAVLRVVDGAPHNLAGCETQALETVCAFLEAL